MGNMTFFENPEFPNTVLDLDNPRMHSSVRTLFELAERNGTIEQLEEFYKDSRATNWERDWSLVKKYYMNDLTYEEIGTEFPEYNLAHSSVSQCIRGTLLKIYKSLKKNIGIDELPDNLVSFQQIQIKKIKALPKSTATLLDNSEHINTYINHLLEDTVGPDEILAKLNLTRDEYTKLRSTVQSHKQLLPTIYLPNQWIQICFSKNKNIEQAIEYMNSHSNVLLYNTLLKKNFIVKFDDILNREPVLGDFNQKHMYKNIHDLLKSKGISSGGFYADHKRGQRTNRLEYYFIPQSQINSAIQLLKDSQSELKAMLNPLEM